MKNEFSKSHIVNSYEIDSNRKLRLDNLFMLMQDVATTAANILNVGKDDLDKFDIAWVLSRIQIDIPVPTKASTQNIPCIPKTTESNVESVIIQSFL